MGLEGNDLGDYAPGDEEPRWDDEFEEMLARLQDVGHNVVGAAEIQAREILGNEDYDRIRDHHLQVDALNLESLQLGIEVSKADIENAKAFADFNHSMAGYRNALTRVLHAVRWALVVAVASGIGWEISRVVR